MFSIHADLVLEKHFMLFYIFKVVVPLNNFVDAFSSGFSDEYKVQKSVRACARACVRAWSEKSMLMVEFQEGSSSLRISNSFFTVSTCMCQMAFWHC